MSTHKVPDNSGDESLFRPWLRPPFNLIGLMVLSAALLFLPSFLYLALENSPPSSSARHTAYELIPVSLLFAFPIGAIMLIATSIVFYCKVVSLWLQRLEANACWNGKSLLVVYVTLLFLVLTLILMLACAFHGAGLLLRNHVPMA